MLHGWGVLPGQTHNQNREPCAAWLGSNPRPDAQPGKEAVWLASAPWLQARLESKGMRLGSTPWPDSYEKNQALCWGLFLGLCYPLSLSCTAGEYAPAGRADQQPRDTLLGNTPRLEARTHMQEARGWGAFLGQTCA